MLTAPPPLLMPDDRESGIGCIGAGFIMADCQLAAYHQAGLRPIALASRNLDRCHDVANRYQIAYRTSDFRELLRERDVRVVDIAVPPDVQPEIIAEAVKQPHIRGILAQKPLAMNFLQARELVRLCQSAGKTLAVNQNMRFDPSIRTAKGLLESGELGEPVLATIDMRAIPHWMPWQKRLGWLTLRMMSIHHLDTFRYWFGNPMRIYTSVRADPRTLKQFEHRDGICLSILEYADGLRAMTCDDVWTGPAREGAAADIGIHWRIEGLTGLARGTIGWPDYPSRSPGTLDYTTIARGQGWQQIRWDEVWFPDAFLGPMADLLCALEQQREPVCSGQDNLITMALVEAAHLSSREHRAVELSEILGESLTSK